MAARPQRTRSTRTRLPSYSAAACSRRRRSLPPRCAPPATSSGAACLWRPHAAHSWRMGQTPTARLPCRPWAHTSRPKPTETGWRHAVPLRRCTQALRSTSHSSLPLMRGCATLHAPSCKPPRSMTPPPCLGCTRSRASARCSASCGATPSITSTAALGGRRWPPLAAWSSVPRRPTATARHFRGHNGPCPSHLGVFRSGRLLPAGASRWPAMPGQMGEKTRHRPGMDPCRSYMRACRL